MPDFDKIFRTDFYGYQRELLVEWKFIYTGIWIAWNTDAHRGLCYSQKISEVIVESTLQGYNIKKYLTYMSKYSSCIALEIHCINYSKTSQKWYTWLEMNVNHVSTLFPCYFYGWERFNCIYAHKSALLFCTNLL